MADAVLAVARQIPRRAHPMTVLRTLVSALGACDPEAEDDSPAATERKSPPPDRADGDPGGRPRSYPRRPASRGPRPGPLPRRQLPLHAEGRTAEPGGGPQLRRGPGAPRRPRVQRLDLRRSGGRLHPGRRPRRHHRRGGHPEGAASRRGQRGGDEDPRGDREPRAGGRLGGGCARPEEEAHGLRPRGLQDGGPPGHPPAEDVEGAGRGRRARRSGTRCPSAWRRWSRREKGLNPNVDFYSASAYRCLGIPTDLFTPVFAVSRIAGWTAHVREQLANNKLIRPEADYQGPRDVRYVPLDERG